MKSQYAVFIYILHRLDFPLVLAKLLYAGTIQLVFFITYQQIY